MTSSKVFEAAILVSLTLWGLMSVVRGAGLSFVASGPNQYRDVEFIELVFESVLGGVFVALLSPRLAAVLSLIATVVAGVVVYQTNGFGHGWVTEKALFWEIAIRSGAATVLLSLLPLVGPVGRLLLQGRSRRG